MGADELLALEREFDALARSTRISGLPRRSVLTGLLVQAHSMIHGGFSEEAVARPVEGMALINRLSYLVDILDAAPPEPIGVSAANAMLPFREDVTLAADQLYLAQYGHLCELIPEVRRGWYDVSGTKETGFVLSHPSAEFADAEARDVVLAEISGGYIVPPPDAFRELFDEVCVADGLDGRVLAATARFFEHYMGACFEAPLFDEAGWHDAIGVSEEDFRRFRAVWLAWAETCLGMAAALKRRLLDDPENEHLGDEYFEWIVPYLSRNFLEGSAIAISGVQAESFDILMRFFAHEPGAANAGDGFFPPLHRLGDGVLFGPDVVRSMMSARNIAYVLNRTDPRGFAELLSHRLEPQMLSIAAASLSRLPGIELRLNTHWARGEIDLLAYQSSTNTALHVQGKAPLPPQGARMTAAVEARAREGLEQLRVLRELPPAGIDEVISGALGRAVTHVEVHDMLLARTCLGTFGVWAELGSVVPSNLHVLNGAVERVLAAGGDLRHLPAGATKVLEDLVRDTVVGWEDTEADFAIARIRMPLLRLRNDRIASARAALQPPSGG